MKTIEVQLTDGQKTTLKVDGLSVEGLHFDGLDQMDGTKTMRRASTIEFDGDSQKWVAIIGFNFRKGKGPHVFCDPSREACLRWERAYLNQEEDVCSETKK